MVVYFPKKERSRYNNIIRGTDKYRKKIKSRRDAIKKTYLILLSPHLKVLNFNDIKGISAISSHENRKMKGIRNPAWVIILVKNTISIPNKLFSWLIINGNEAINNALAGVGNPMKESVCRVSKLNFARR